MKLMHLKRFFYFLLGHPLKKIRSLEQTKLLLFMQGGNPNKQKHEPNKMMDTYNMKPDLLEKKIDLHTFIINWDTLFML